MTDSYIYVIIALLPLAALMLVFQVNPYHALVIRAILGAVAALVYVVLGAADVGLTEALVGTMLAVTLYVIAVRSSLVMRVGILKGFKTEKEIDAQELIANFQKILSKYHLRLELIEYPHRQALELALSAQEIHAICAQPEQLELESAHTYHTAIRVRRLFEILKTELTSPLTKLSYVTELTSPLTKLSYVTVSNTEDKH